MTGTMRRWKKLWKTRIEGIFAAAHTLKGVAGNLELTPLYETCTRLSDATRGGKKDGDVQGLFLAVREAYRNVMENLKKLA